MRSLVGITAFLMSLMFALSSWAQTQAALNEDACQSYQRSNAELNQTYTQILAEYAADRPFIAKLKQAQRAWVKFRDFHADSLFPATNKQKSYGRVYPACRCSELAKLTQERVTQLRLWLEGTEEGDVCSGSIRHKKNE